MARLRFAQAGVTAIHAPMYRETLVQLADQIELVGFSDPDPEAARKSLKAPVEDVPVYGTLTELLERAKPDAVLVSATMREMPDLMLQVAQAGVHVWAEKPFAVHSSQLEPVAAEIERRSLHFSCGYSWRFHPVSLLIKQLLDDGILGKPYSIDYRFITSSIKTRRPDNWYFDPEQSGGGILNWLGCHWLDLTRFLIGSEFARLTSLEANVSGDAPGVEDAAVVGWQHQNGVVGSLHAGYYVPSGGETAIGLRGSLGMVSWDVNAAKVVIRSAHPSWETGPVRTLEVPTANRPGYGAEGYTLLKAFAAAIRGEGSSGFTIDDAIQSLRIIEAAHESARTGHTVTL